MPLIKRNNVKYVARVNANTGNPKTKFRYFYSNDAYKAYLNGTNPATTQNTSPTTTNAATSENHKYVKRIDATGNSKNKYRYFYSEKEVQSYMNNQKSVKLKDVINGSLTRGKNAVEKFMKNTAENIKKTVDNAADKVAQKTKATVDKAVDKSLDVANKMPKKIDKVVTKTKEVGEKIYDDKNNIYDVNRQNYNQKIEKVRATKEWQDIVARKDPEYTKKNSDGSTSYLIDDYLAKKKNPILDVVDDIASGRNVTVNKIEKDAVVAGLKEQAFSAITIGMIAVGVGSKLLIEKSKLRQGSYNDEIDAIYDTISSGQEYVKQFSSSGGNVSKEDVEKMMTVIENSQKVKDATQLAKSVNEDNIVNAAKIIMNSESMPEEVKSNEYYKMANDTLSNLSEEEIIMLNILLNNIRNGR